MEGRHCFAHLSIEENLLTGAYTRSDGKTAIAETAASAPELALFVEFFARAKRGIIR